VTRIACLYGSNEVHQLNFVVDSGKAEKESPTGAKLRKRRKKTPPRLKRRLDFQKLI
jgi:hypothetical protein